VIRRALLPVALALLTGLAAPAGAQVRYDELLRRDDVRHGTLGPAGGRVYAERLTAAPGLVGRFGYGQPLAGFVDPIVLGLREAGVELELSESGATWKPSHLEARWSAEGLTLVERKLVTEDDVLVDRVTLRNGSERLRVLDLTLRGGSTPLLDRLRSGQRPLDLSEAASAVTGARADVMAWPAGRLQYDAVMYVLPDAAGPLVAVGGDDGLPLQSRLALPPSGPQRSVLHLLGTWQTSTTEAPTASFRLHLDDGTSVDREWPATAGSIEPPPGWRRLVLPGAGRPAVQLSYTAPPGRFVQALTLLPGEGPDVPVLLAATVETLPEIGRMPVLIGRLDAAGHPVHLALAGDGFVVEPEARSMVRTVTLQPGASLDVQIVLATEGKPFAAALAALAMAEDTGLLPRHVAESERWFAEQAPELRCSDARLEQVWAYRWWLVRHLRRELERPGFSLPVVFDGVTDERHAAVGVRSAAFVLDEVRWLGTHETAQGQVRTLLQHRSPGGLLRSVRLAGTGSCATQRIAAAAIGAWAVHGDEQFLREMLPLLTTSLEATHALVDADGDDLPGPPGPWYGRWRPRPDGELPEPGTPTPAAAAWTFESARALAAAWAWLGDEERADGLDRFALRVKRVTRERLWDDGYGPLAADGSPDGGPGDASALLPFVVGLDTDPVRLERALSTPVGSTAAGWDGPDEDCNDPDARHPELAVLAAEAIATAVHAGVAPVETFVERMKTLTDLQFEPGGPALRACRAPVGGAGGCRDGFHGSYNDLLIRHVGGLKPRIDGRIELAPIDVGLDHFRFRRLPHRGRQVEIVWDRPDGQTVWPDRPEGYSLVVDDEFVVTLPELQRFLAD
jgi:hypothetical protein